MADVAGKMKREDSMYSDKNASTIGFGPQKRNPTWRSNDARTAHARTMTAQKAEGIQEPPEAHNYLVYVIGIAMCMSGMAYGYDTGFFGGTLALPSFIADFGDTTSSKANMVSLFKAGSFFGTALQLPITQKYGRKFSVQVANIIFIASAFPQIFAAGSVPIFMFGRFMGGFAVGILCITVPIYLAEFSPSSFRGRIIGFFDIMQAVGSLLGFWIGYIVQQSMASNRFQWQLPVFLQLAPAAVLLVAAPFLPETPRWLIGAGRHEQAMKNLCYLRKLPESHPYIQYEYGLTKSQVDAELAIRGDASILKLLKELFTLRSPRRRVLLGISIIALKAFSGINAINYYGPTIFRQLGFIGTRNALFANGVYGCVRFVFTVLFGLFVVDRIGRRRPLIFGCIFLSLCLFFVGGYLTATGIKTDDAPKVAGDYVAITAIFLYAAGYSMGWNSVPLTLVSEIFDLRFRVISMTLCIMTQWLSEFVIQQITPYALKNITTKTYFIFSSIFICGAPFIYFFVPETTGLSLENMDQLFGGDGQPHDVERAVADGNKTEQQAIEDVSELRSEPRMERIVE